jgi:enoyl-[acyl-carrier-protein] reductase (NADH)
MLTPRLPRINAAGGQAIGISTDVSSESSVKNAFAEIQKEFKGKKLAAAIFNVGGRFVRKPFLELSLEEYEAGYAANGYAISLRRRVLMIALTSDIEERDFSFLLKLPCLSSLNLSQIPHTRLL